METESTTPGRGSVESAKWFRKRLDELGIGLNALARWMIAAGDDRQPATILRSIQRMASGTWQAAGEGLW